MQQQPWIRGALFVVLALGVVWAVSAYRRSVTQASSALETAAGAANATTVTLVERRAASDPSGTRAAGTATQRSTAEGPGDSHGVLDRQRADSIRRRAAEHRAAEQARSARGTKGGESAGAGAVAPHDLTPQEAQRRRDYLQRAVHEQYFPVARSCYDELLGRTPTASGKVILSFVIVGDGDAGVVDRVELKDGTTIDDPEFTQCMRESMYTTVFEPPPPGATETTVVYPIELSP